MSRDDGSATLSGNLTSAQPVWFVNPAASDLHLASDSPAIEAAESSQTLNIDIDGETRPTGVAADVGADEWAPE